MDFFNEAPLHLKEKVYRHMCLKHHPDKNEDKRSAEEVFKHIQTKADAFLR